MDYTPTGFTTVRPVYCRNNTTGSTWIVPTSVVFSNISTMRRFLDFVLEDWKKESAPFQKACDEATIESQMVAAVGRVFSDLRPRFQYLCLLVRHVLLCAP